MRRSRHLTAACLSAIWLAAALVCFACAADEMGDGNAPPPADGGFDAGVNPGRDASAMCQSDRDCGPGLICRNGVCITEPDGGTVTDTGPPEDEHLEFQPPVGSESYVFVVNTTLGTVAKIAPGSLANIEVTSIEVGVHPTILYVIPGTDNAVVLNEGSRSVSVIQASDERDTVTEVYVGQPYTSMQLSPDGRYLITYFDQSEVWTDPSNSASKVAIVDVTSVLDGDPQVYEFAVGYRVTDVFFDLRMGPHGPVSTRALIVSKSEVAVATLATIEDVWILPRVWIDDPQAEVVETREVLITPEADLLLIRNFHATTLTVVDVEAELSTRLLLPGVPTDLDLSPGGDVALVVLRAQNTVARVDIEADLVNVVVVDGVRTFDPDGDGVPTPEELTQVAAFDPAGEPLVVGQAEPYIRADGSLAAVLYTNVDRREEISILDVDAMQIEYLGRLINKLVDYVVVSPTAHTALVVHRPEFGSEETDPVELAIDMLHGYTLVDLPTGATFQQVADAPVGPMAFSSTGRYALLTVFDEAMEVNELHVIDLLRLTLQMDFVPLEALPLFVGALPGAEVGYVAQEHPYGKITFVDMQSLSKRAVTGYELNAE